jgi:uncharacterized repeat protein (TIGR02543 family)
VFTSWNDDDKSVSRTISHGGEYTADYKAQHKLTIESPYGSPKGEGWYNSGSEANVSISSTEGKIIQHVFTGWSGDLSGQQTTVSVTMDKPRTIKANWETNYLRLYMLIAGLIALTVITATVMVYIRKKNKSF